MILARIFENKLMASLKDIKYFVKLVETDQIFFSREWPTFVKKRLNSFLVFSTEYNAVLLICSALWKALLFSFYQLFPLLFPWIFESFFMCKLFFNFFIWLCRFMFFIFHIQFLLLNRWFFNILLIQGFFTSLRFTVYREN